MAPATTPPHDPARLAGAKLAIDATKKPPYPTQALPPPEHLQQVEDHWSAYGF